MPLCEVCTSLDPEDEKAYGTPLGKYHELVSREEEGCGGCAFFCEVLRSSQRWKDRLEVCVAAQDGGPEIKKLDVIRAIPVNSSDEKCLSQISSWVSECGEHENRSNLDRTARLPERVIEIPSDPGIPPRICSTNGTEGAYVVLSFYLGDVEPPATLQGIEWDRLPAALDINDLPKTVADAIEITRRLGYQYLWTRDLCMPSGQIRAFQSLAIYAQAALMLAATDGTDGNSGLFYDRQILYSPPLGRDKNRYLRQELLTRRSQVEDALLPGRGWQIIERLLAPRIVHFTSRQMIWECASGFLFEAAKVMEKNEMSDERDIKRAVQPYIHAALQNRADDAGSSTGEDGPMTIFAARLGMWLRCVDTFSVGSFKDAAGKLRAIGVLASAVDDGTMGEYLAGIWSRNIASGLAWSRPYFLLRAAPSYRAPSWSWASVDGATSSTSLFAPTDMMDEHAKDPSWLNKYGLKLVSHNMVPADPSNPYGGVLEGSHIVVEGACLGFKTFTTAFAGHESGFQIIPVLDESQIFDCACCSPRPDDVQQAQSATFAQDIDHHICLILEGDAWRLRDEYEPGRGFCSCLILRACEESGVFRRVGLLAIRLEYFGNTLEDPDGTFDAVGWERRQLKLI